MATATAFDEVVDLLGQLHRPIDEVARWLQAAQPPTAATRFAVSGSGGFAPYPER